MASENLVRGKFMAVMVSAVTSGTLFIFYCAIIFFYYFRSQGCERTIVLLLGGLFLFAILFFALYSMLIKIFLPGNVQVEVSNPETAVPIVGTVATSISVLMYF